MATPNTATALQPLASVDIQFDTTYDQYKANQLVEALRTAEDAVNTVMQLVAAINGTVNNLPGVKAHVLATEEGLGPEHTVSGLVAGQVLLATAANSAEFSTLKLTQLSDVDPTSFNEPVQGNVLTWMNGYLALAAPTTSTAHLTQTFLTVNPEEATLSNSLPLVAGTNITFERSASTGLTINAASGTSGISEIDGGDALSTYLITQNLNGGNANPNGFIGPPIDGGMA